MPKGLLRSVAGLQQTVTSGGNLFKYNFYKVQLSKATGSEAEISRRWAARGPATENAMHFDFWPSKG